MPLLLVVLVFNSCEEDDENPTPVIETGTMADVEGNEYTTVKIGSKWWMAENLRVTKYRNGNPIPFVQNTIDEWSTSLDAYCSYSPTAPGFLYNWSAVNNPSQLAPEGWHIPSDDEWKELEKHLGMTNDQAEGTGWRGDDQGEKLKMEGNSGWSVYDGIWSTNESGFSAEAGSCIMFDGKSGFPGLQYHGFWWSITEHDSNNSWYRYLDYKNKDVFRSHGNKHYGFSVRCIKD